MFLSKTASSLLASSYYKKQADSYGKLLDIFVPEEKRNDKKYVRSLKKDIYLAHIRQNGTPEEYFRYGFEKLSEAGRNEYMLDKDSSPVFRAVEGKGTRKIFTDKYLAYEKFKPYYKRELVEVRSDADAEKFREFAGKHGRFIVKPMAQYGGHGIYIDSVENCTADEKFKQILSRGESIVEELLIQDERMSAFNPGTVNTIRIVTYTRNDDMQIIQSSMRIGCGKSVVDNGCLSCGIDYESGVIITKGRMAHEPGLYVFHPDTGYQILGSKIPCWEDLKKLLSELVRVFPEQPLVGWDLALCNHGWTMIEANTRPQVQILSGDGIGMRKIIEEKILKYQ